MSDTPRTDSAICRYAASHFNPAEEIRFEGSELVRADFARELERELNAEKGQWQLEAESANRYKDENAKLREVGDRMAMDLEGLRELLRSSGYNPGWGNGCLADWKALKR